MSFTFWLQFVLVCVIGAMSPGPSVALIIRNSVRFSRAAGILSAIGHACQFYTNNWKHISSRSRSYVFN